MRAAHHRMTKHLYDYHSVEPLSYRRRRRLYDLRAILYSSGGYNETAFRRHAS